MYYYLLNLCIFMGFTALEQIWRWKYLVHLTFPLHYRFKSYKEKLGLVHKYLGDLTSFHKDKYTWSFIYIFFAKETEVGDISFYIWLAKEFDLETRILYEYWYNNCVKLIPMKHKWSGPYYYLDGGPLYIDPENPWAIVKIYRKIYVLPELRYKYIHSFLYDNRIKDNFGLSFDFYIIFENIFCFLKYFMQIAIYVSLFLKIFPYFIYKSFSLQYLYRWEKKEIILSNGVHHITDPLIIYDWYLCWKKYYNIKFDESYIVLKKVTNFLYLINLTNLYDKLDMILFFIFILSLKNVFLSKNLLYMKIYIIFFNCLEQSKYYSLNIIEKKDQIRFGKFIFDSLYCVIGKCFVKETKKKYLKFICNN